MAYLFGGADPETARDLTVDFADPRGIPVPPVDDLFGWGLVQPRVVYPVLSVPFVKMFGAYGLAVVPLLAAVALTILLTLILMRRYGNVVAVATMLLVNGSLFLMSFHTGMLTESLSGLFAVLALLAAWRWLDRPSPWLLVAMGAATAASAFTRQATLIMAGAFVMAWLLGSIVGRRNSPWMWPAIVVGGTAVGCQVLQSLVFPSFSQLDQFLKQAGAETLGEAILRVPAMLLHILASDAAAMMRADRTLLFLIGLAVASMILFWRRTESHLLLGAILGIALYNVTNGTPTQFRYATPGLVFYVLAAAVIIAHTADRVTKAIADRRNGSMQEGTSDSLPPSAAPSAEPAA
ncbi:hypothetical protein [Agromyces sp. NPDC058126]|uniref:hypothetical protein n=1 Tax=Agromyces sp. NPDC058126 TaxID=3346350 RepID=UPI0036DC6111